MRCCRMTIWSVPSLLREHPEAQSGVQKTGNFALDRYVPEMDIVVVLAMLRQCKVALHRTIWTGRRESP